MNELSLRESLVTLSRSLYDRGYSCGSSGNLSARLDEGMLITPTGACLGRLEPDRITKVSWDGRPLSGDPPSKEAPLHLAVYQERHSAGAVVHLHSTCLVCVSCMTDIDPSDCLPPLTPYQVMKAGRLPLVPYHPPGDPALAQAVRLQARQHHAMLLANHGPVVAGPNLAAAVDIAEELEEAAKIFLSLRGSPTRLLSEHQVRALRGNTQQS